MDKPEFKFAMPDADPGDAPPANAWIVDDNTLYLVIDEAYLVKCRKIGGKWAAASIRIPIDEPLIDPEWAGRTPIPVPDDAAPAAKRAVTALRTFIARYGPDADGEEE